MSTTYRPLHRVVLYYWYMGKLESKVISHKTFNILFSSQAMKWFDKIAFEYYRKHGYGSFIKKKDKTLAGYYYVAGGGTLVYVLV